jgi:8-oxo-dGTP diphosphatase
MLKAMIAAFWRRAPKWVRRAGVLVIESRFTVTAAAVVTDAQGRVLLLRHRFRPGSGWGIPGGFLQPREQPEAAIRRELREETGLEVAAARLVQVRTLQKYRQVEILFHCHPIGTASPTAFEISRAEWFAPDALPERLSNDQRELIARALTGGNDEGVDF